MNRKRVSGLIGIIGGGAWLAYNAQFYSQQGIVTVALPLILLVLGLVYFFGSKDAA